jgi:hypothetical protein
MRSEEQPKRSEASISLQYSISPVYVLGTHGIVAASGSQQRNAQRMYSTIYARNFIAELFGWWRAMQ